MAKTTNQAIDIAKIFFAFCVIGIHTVVFQDINYNFWYYLQHLIFTMAVPFFLCVPDFFIILTKITP